MRAAIQQGNTKALFAAAETPAAALNTHGIDRFHAASGAHRPPIFWQGAWDAEALFIRFQVNNDRHVLARRTEINSQVCEDSCVECFIAAPDGRSYVNIECNPIGTLLASHVRDARRTENGFADFSRCEANSIERIQVAHHIRQPIVTDSPERRSWHIALRIAWDFFPFFPSPPQNGSEIRANCYACREHGAEPFWAAWSPIGDALNFHVPSVFGSWLFS